MSRYATATETQRLRRDVFGDFDDLDGDGNFAAADKSTRILSVQKKTVRLESHEKFQNEYGLICISRATSWNTPRDAHLAAYYPVN